jgi:hypothetical protein
MFGFFADHISQFAGHFHWFLLQEIHNYATEGTKWRCESLALLVGNSAWEELGYNVSMIVYVIYVIQDLMNTPYQWVYVILLMQEV